MENNYKKTTDEYYALYQAFRLSGFDRDQAFDLVKTMCNSVMFNNVSEQIEREERRKRRREAGIKNIVNELRKADDVNDILNQAGGTDGKLQNV